MNICEFKNNDEKAWDDYVLNHPDSTFYHQLGWKHVVERSYGHKPYYLLAKDDGIIIGVLPLFYLKSLFFGRKLVSLPFAPYGGAIGNSSIIEELLIKHAIEISEGVGADYLELRNNTNRPSKLLSNSNYMTLILKLNKDPEVVWGGFNNKVRNAIRKSLNSGLEIGKGSIEDFYKLYSKNMRDLGTPTHSRKFFDNVISESKRKADVLVVRQKSEPVSAAILLYFKDTVISGWAASDREYRNLSPNNSLYWNAIKSASEEGYRFFDFGRSIAGGGTYNFKKPWGAEEKQLQYKYHLNRIKQLPDTSQVNSKRMMIAKVWKKLPINLTKLVGPILRSEFP